MSLTERATNLIRTAINVDRRKHDNFGINPVEFLLLHRANKAEYAHTPDWEKLELTLHQPVFIYCNLTKGGACHNVIEGIYKNKDDDDLSIGPYVFTSRIYEVWQTKLGRASFPIALNSRARLLSPATGETSTLPARGRIKGRLYWIRSDMMKELDKFKLNGLLFRRRKVPILIPYRTDNPANQENMEMMFAWMYVGRRRYWDDVPASNLRRCRIINQRDLRHNPVSVQHLYYFFDAWGVANK